MWRAFPTSEGQDLGLRLSGPGSRSVALLFDLVLFVVGLGIVSLIASFILSKLFGSFGVELVSGAWRMLLLFFASFGALAAIFRWRTPGKAALGLEVVDANGAPATTMQHFVRGLALIPELVPVPFPIGLMVMLVHPEGRRLGDLLAGTYVITTGFEVTGRRRRRRKARGEGAPTLEFTPAALGRLTAEDRAMLAELTRRTDLRLGVVDDLEVRLAKHLAARMRLADDPNRDPAALLRDVRAALG